MKAGSGPMNGRKKYMIRSDMEGVSGVTTYEEVIPGAPDFAFGQRMMMADLNALALGLNEGGADEIVIYDEHYYGRNVLPDDLPDNVSFICGKPPYRKDWAGGLDESFAGMIMLGFHSKAGTPGGLLAHTYEPDIADIRINHRSVGEIGVESAIAGECGVPLLMLTGDSAGVAEAEALVPGCVGVSVKQSLGEQAACCYPLVVTSGRIREAARQAASTASAPAVFRFASPVRMDIDLRPGVYRLAYERLFPADVEEGTVRLSGDSVLEVWAEYWRKKIAAQKEAESHHER